MRCLTCECFIFIVNFVYHALIFFFFKPTNKAKYIVFLSMQQGYLTSDWLSGLQWLGSSHNSPFVVWLKNALHSNRGERFLTIVTKAITWYMQFSRKTKTKVWKHYSNLKI